MGPATSPMHAERRLRRRRVHVIGRSSPFSGDDAVEGEPNALVFKSPKSGVSLWRREAKPLQAQEPPLPLGREGRRVPVSLPRSLGSFENQREAACERALPTLLKLANLPSTRADSLVLSGGASWRDALL